MNAINGRALRAIEGRIFERGEGGVEDAAAAYSLDQLLMTIRAARARSRASVATLPELAFHTQPVAAAGDAVWSAGEIIGHLAESMLWFGFALERLAGRDPDTPVDIPTVCVRDRAATLALLDEADRLLDKNLASAAKLPDEARVDLGGLGTPGVRGLLLLHAMHEAGHADQLRALGCEDTSPRDVRFEPSQI
jgi:hypothetical protein